VLSKGGKESCPNCGEDFEKEWNDDARNGMLLLFPCLPAATALSAVALPATAALPAATALAAAGCAPRCPAVLCCAVLCYTVLCCAMLCYAVLCCALCCCAVRCAVCCVLMPCAQARVHSSCK